MSNFGQFHAYVIDSDSRSRMLLRQAMTAVPEFTKITQLADLRDAISNIRMADECDLVFVSERFERKEVTKFFEELRKIKQSQDAAFIVILEGTRQAANDIAKNMLDGIDGLLFEPYSVNQLRELAELASKVKKERFGAREEAAIRFLLVDVIKELDRAAFLIQAGDEKSSAIQRFAESCKFFHTLDVVKKDLYFKILVEVFGNLPAPANLLSQYKGASQRLRRKIVEKMRTDGKA